MTYPKKFHLFQVLDAVYKPLSKPIESIYSKPKGSEIYAQCTATMEIVVDGKESIFTGTYDELWPKMVKKLRTYKRCFGY